MEGSINLTDPFCISCKGQVKLSSEWDLLPCMVMLFAMASAVVQESVLRPAQICSRGRQRDTGGAGGRGEAESEVEGNGRWNKNADPLGGFFMGFFVCLGGGGFLGFSLLLFCFCFFARLC